MLDSKQLALVYLMEECNRVSSLCAKSIHNVHKKKFNNDIEQHMGILFNAMREVVEEFKLDEHRVEKSLHEEVDRRNKER